MNGHSREEGQGLNEFNRDQIDDVEPLGGDQGLAVPKERYELSEQQEQTIRDSLLKITLY